MGRKNILNSNGAKKSKYSHDVLKDDGSIADKSLNIDASTYPVTDQTQFSDDQKQFSDGQEERVDRSSILSEEIDDLIDKFIDENFPGSKDKLEEQIEQLKDDIWQNICEHREVEEKEMQGGKIKVENESESDNDKQIISEEEIKNRLYRSINNMKVFELDLDADRALSNIDLRYYVKLLKIPNYSGVFMRKEDLPKRINPVECGIVNLNTPDHLEAHWICYAKVYKNRVYFDSFGEKIPLEIQRYMKTEEEFRDNTPVIERSADTLQSMDTKISGHLCLFVLTSLMRERLQFKQVMDQLKYAYAEHFY